MAHLDIDTVLGWRGRTVRGNDGDAIGELGDVYLDRETEAPAWAGVRTGLFGRHQSFLPLDAVLEDGDELRVPYDKELVKDAPRVDPEGVAFGEDDEARLLAHYGPARSRTERPPDDGILESGSAGD